MASVQVSFPSDLEGMLRSEIWNYKTDPPHNGAGFSFFARFAHEPFGGNAIFFENLMQFSIVRGTASVNPHGHYVSAIIAYALCKFLKNTPLICSIIQKPNLFGLLID